MKILKSCLLIFALITALSTQAQTAEEIINKYIEAIGGKEKLSQVNSLYMEVSTQAMGMELPGMVTILNGKGYKSEAEYNGQKIVQCITDTGGWTINPMMGLSTPTPMPEDQYKASKRQIYINSLFNFTANGSKAELLGTENTGGASAYKIKITAPDSTESTYFIDSATNYITKVVMNADMMGQQMEITAAMSNYQKTDFGYAIPFTMETDIGGQITYTTTVTKAEINKPVDPAIFQMPK